ncbi:MAG: glycosyltransferase [Chloroflexi bacterium]|jgi:GT2 family glycosyltransferase|nr:glycosyltransferase [Chloroflexota bacterium]
MFLSLSLAALAWLVIVLIVRDWQRARRLPALQHSPVLASRPFVSIVIPARNEAANIARCLDGALSQRYAPYEVIVVDDGSTDATPRILHDYATRFSDKLTVVTGRPLPRGWVGKCNACLHGAQHARGDWLLFLDADTAPQPNLIAALLALAQQRGLDLVSVLPFNELRTWSEQLVLPVFYQFALTAFPLQRNLSADPPASNVLANGQCLLVRADAYWSLGGHEVVKDKVLEDIEFAQAMRRAGYRIGLATAFDHLRVRMYHNLAEVVQGLGKHAAAGRRASGWRAFWAVLRMSLTLLAPWLLSIAAINHVAAQPLAWHSGLALVVTGGALGVTLGFWAQRYRQWYALPRRMGVLAALGWLIYLFIVVRGTLQVLFRRGVTWKERVYSS